MNKILLTPLPFDKAKDYFEMTLKNGNSLAKKLLRTIDFELGTFTSITSISADTSLLNNFYNWGILPQNSKELLPFGDRKILKSKKSSSINELAKFIQNILFNKTAFSCVFEEVAFEKDAQCLSKMHSYIHCFDREVYYLLSSKNFSTAALLDCIQAADAQWYYLNIIADIGTLDDKKDFSDKDLIQLASQSSCLILGAYDMEGYVCFQKHAK